MDNSPSSEITIKGSLKGSGLHAELPLAHCRQMVALAREEAAKTVKHGRREAVIVARRIRQRARRLGYEAGLRAGRKELEGILEGLRPTYRSCSDAAQDDAVTLAHHLAEEVIEHTFINKPESFLPLLNRAFEILKHSREFILSFHPRYETSMKAISPLLPPGVTLRVHLDPHGADFIIVSEEGAVESAWREALKERIASSANRMPKGDAHGGAQ